MTDAPVTPVIGPLLALLRSRKVIVSAVIFVVALLVQSFPVLAPIQGTLVALLTVILVAIVSGISLEDAAKYVGTRGYTTVTAVNGEPAPDDALRTLINDVLDERAASAPTEPIVAP